MTVINANEYKLTQISKDWCKVSTN